MSKNALWFPCPYKTYNTAMNKISTVNEYIAAAPEGVRNQLEVIRKTIQEAAPEAKEKISYGLATFTLNGNLVHFGSFKDHIGFFPTASGVEAFKEELGPYAVSKGTIHFPLDKPLPLDLIRKIVKFRAKQNIERKKK
jgi:uncharacterized protein YdhG (YjbR/CyaY superfamily)